MLDFDSPVKMKFLRNWPKFLDCDQSWSELKLVNLIFAARKCNIWSLMLLFIMHVLICQPKSIKIHFTVLLRKWYISNVPFQNYSLSWRRYRWKGKWVASRNWCRFHSMATFHFKLLENFLEVQVQNTVWALGLQLPSIFFFCLFIYIIYSSVLQIGSDLQITPTPKQKWWGGAEWTCAEVVKTCGAEVKAWVASVIWWCLAKNQTLE